MFHKTEIENHVVDFYRELFSSEQSNLDFDALLRDFPVRGLSIENIHSLSREFTVAEVLLVPKDMHPMKAPGPDSFHILFYK